MERYGYFMTEEGGLNFIEKDTKIDLNPTIFKNLKDCIRCALYYNTSLNGRKLTYFKILNNNDIIQYIHNISTKEHVFGYLHLCFKNKDNDLEPVQLLSICNKMYCNMLECVCACKYYPENNIEDCAVKVGYCKLLTNDDIMYELHCSYV